jgi:hypothetical protein
VPVEQNIGNGLAIIPVDSMDKDIYVENGEVFQKMPLTYVQNKPNIRADGVDVLTITGLPNPITVKWPDGLTTEETDGFVSFTLDLAGDYEVVLDAPHYQREVINVSAVDPE